MSYFRSISVAALSIFVIASLAQTRHAVLKLESQRHELFDYPGGRFMPVWGGTTLLMAIGNESDEPVILAIDKDGLQERIGFSFPGGRYLTITGLAGAVDGSIAAIGTCYSADGQWGTFLARIARDRTHKLVIQLWPYVPHVIAFSPDGEIWTIGAVRTPDNLGISALNVLRRFDASGKQLGTASVAAKGRFMDAAMNSLMAASNDRVGWLTNADEYIEFGLDGREAARFAPPPGPLPEVFDTEMALSRGNDVLVATRDGRSERIWLLDRTEHAWHEVESNSQELCSSTACVGRDPGSVETLGFDGDRVVMLGGLGATGGVISRYALSTPK